MHIKWQPLEASEIAFLQSKETLYVFDLRGPNVTPWKKIPDFWKYENVMPWILDGQHVAVNEDHTRITYVHENDYLVAPKETDPRISLIERLPTKQLENHSALWMGVPHPMADILAARYTMQLNYLFTDYKKYNDKHAQKKAFGALTPTWKIVADIDDVVPYRTKNSPWFLKRQHGSGGWQVINLAHAEDTDVEHALAQRTGWFIEEKIRGDIYSVQCIRFPKESKTIIFGLVNQIINETTHFIGGRILSLTSTKPSVQIQIQDVIQRIDNHLGDYDGFYGIDFILTDTNKVYALEANVRMTAMSIPVLLANSMHKDVDFLEDIDMAAIEANDIVMTEDLVRRAADVLRPR